MAKKEPEKKYCSACGQPIGKSLEKREAEGLAKGLNKLARATFKAVEWATRPPKHNSTKNK